MKTKVMVLSQAHFNMQRALARGYSTLRQKLDDLFFTNPNSIDVITSTVLIEEIPSTGPRKRSAKHNNSTKSTRSFHGSVTIKVVYPSGRTIDARIKTWGDLCIIEPVLPNTAYFLVERKSLNKEVVDLRELDYIRMYHSKANDEFASYFR